MKNLLFLIIILFCLSACNNNASKNNGAPDRSVRDSVRDPLTVQPESEAIPSDMEIKNDSVVVPDTAGR